MLMKRTIVYICVFGVIAAVANSNAQTIAWQNPVEISGTSDVSTLGTYFASWAPYDGSASSEPVNGVSFQGFSDLPGLSSTFPGGNGGPYFNSPGTPDANYNSILGYATWANGQNASFSWGGMTPGDTYEVQLWVEDARNSATDARWENFSGGDGQLENAAYGTDTSAAVGYSAPLFSSPVGAPGFYITGTFVADSSASEEILVTGWDVNGNNQSAQLNLMQVRDITPVPEPSAFALLVGGGLAAVLGLSGLHRTSQRRAKNHPSA